MRGRSCAEQTLGADHLLEYLEELSVHAGARIPTPQAVLRIIASKACRYPPPPPYEPNAVLAGTIPAAQAHEQA